MCKKATSTRKECRRQKRESVCKAGWLAGCLSVKRNELRRGNELQGTHHTFSARVRIRGHGLEAPPYRC